MTSGMGPFDLATVRTVMGPQGDATTKSLSADFYAELDREFDGFAGHTLVSRHSFDTPWESWERHPKGDELVYLLEGDTDFLLRHEGKETTIRVNVPGTYITVPKGAWHTASPRKPTTMLFFTPGEGTEHAEDPKP